MLFFYYETVLLDARTAASSSKSIVVFFVDIKSTLSWVLLRAMPRDAYVVVRARLVSPLSKFATLQRPKILIF